MAYPSLMSHKSGCLVCGEPLTYRKGHSKLKRVYCGRSFDSNASCKQGHYVCDFCHSAGAFGLTERFCIDTKLDDPIEIAQLLMRAPPVKMHGPEHHFLVPAVLIAAYCDVKGTPPPRSAGWSARPGRGRAEPNGRVRRSRTCARACGGNGPPASGP